MVRDKNSVLKLNIADVVFFRNRNSSSMISYAEPYQF